VSGKKQGFADTRGTLFFDVARIVSTHHPEAVFLENVKNFAGHDNGNTLLTVKKTLEELGYNVYSQVLNASHYGIPTSRERIYIVALREDLQSTFTFPKPSHTPVQLQDYLLLDHLTDSFVIEREDMVFKEEVPKPDENGLYPARPIRIGTIGRGGQGERIYSPKGHAITFSAYGGGVASCTGAYLVNGRVRKLSPRECACVMGFGDDFILPTSPRWAWRQFGNSVAVGVVEAVAGQIALVLNGGQASND
jgi:DNA (cytosine-5)-methyltransferase 1